MIMRTIDRYVLALFMVSWSVLQVSSTRVFAQLPALIDLAHTSADVTISGAASRGSTGEDIVVADLNGDGLSDIIIASGTASPLGRTEVGEVDVLWGHSTLDSLIDLRNFSGEMTRIFGKAGERAVRVRLASGDYNDDGYDDLVIGLPLYPFPWSDGKVYIIFGSAEFPDTLDLGSPSVETTVILGSGGFMGRTIATGNINGDNYEDLIVGAPFHSEDDNGEVYIVYGRGSFPDFMQLNLTPPDVTYIRDTEPYQLTGSSLASKDVNHDGFDDLLIGSSGYYQGKGTLLYGSEVMPDTILLSDPLLDSKKIYDEPGQLGANVALGDVNGDGRDDFIIAVPAADALGFANCGEVYIIYDIQSLPDSIYVGSDEIQMTRLLGQGNEQQYGTRMICANVSGDECDDVIVSSYKNELISSDVDKVTVFYGSPSMPDSIYLQSDSSLTKILGESRDDYFGHSLTSGDVNHDDVTDLLAGALYADPFGRTSAGRVYALF
ncbi:MAG: FG-GAP repeat protein, partial [Chitinivibrionia bacterium]|nr:FG-GAP repeat protein [Chitinivibrionia bacterium]